MVESTPTPPGPPSSTTSTSDPRSARTWAAVVGLTRPNRLADGAASPPSKARRSRNASGWPGTRSPTSPPAEAPRERNRQRVPGPPEPHRGAPAGHGVGHQRRADQEQREGS